MPKDTAGSTIWNIGKLVDAIKGTNPDATRVEIPKFQRRLVWSEQQKIDLIDSIHRGYPIGSVLLFKRPNPGGQQELFQVVDGLQRTSTLVGYTNAPLEYISADLLPDTIVASAISRLGASEEAAKKIVLDWMRSTREMTFSAGFRPDKLAEHLAARFSAPEAVDELTEDLAPALDELKSRVDISGVSIPVVTYAGPEGELPEIFERINQSGTKLNKYEVFAATWLNSATLVNNTSVRQAINEKYQALLTRGFTIDGLESDKQIQDFNLFEYLFGMGKWLVKAHGLLFREKDDPAETEPAAFSLSCVVLGHQLSRMGELQRLMPRADDDVIDPTRMEEAIAQSADFVQDVLSPFISLRLNSTTDGVDIAHGELQIVSMIARAVIGRWDTRGDWTERPGWQGDWDILRKNLPQYYLLELLEETWRGPLYSLLYNRVWDVDEDGIVVGPSQHYVRTPTIDTWDVVTKSWFDKQMAREQRSRSHVRSVDRVFLRFVYSNLVSHQENKQQTFELEHLFPVSRLKNVVPADGPGWPISCIANLALFTKSLNREKSANTIAEYLAENEISAAERQMLDKFLLCSPDDVVIDSDFDRETYKTFLEHRWSVLRKQLYSGLGVA